jgi:hypothetical protein
MATACSTELSTLFLVLSNKARRVRPALSSLDQGERRRPVPHAVAVHPSP